jgi:hypothetical protein
MKTCVKNFRWIIPTGITIFQALFSAVWYDHSKSTKVPHASVLLEMITVQRKKSQGRTVWILQKGIYQ